MGSEGRKHLSKTHGWLSISPKKHQVCKSPAEDNSLVPFCHKGCICTPTCTGVLQEQNPHQTRARLPQEGTAAEGTSHEDQDPRQRLAHVWRDFLRRDRGYSGQSGAQRQDAQHLREHAPPSPLPPATQLGELLSTPVQGAGTPQGPRRLEQGEGHVWGKGELRAKADPSHPNLPRFKGKRGALSSCRLFVPVISTKLHTYLQ